MPYVWIFLLVLTTVWAFWADVVFAPFLPFAATEGGWLAGLVALSVGTTVILTLMNMVEEKIVNQAAADQGDHH
jgi:hypothetical protein